MSDRNEAVATTADGEQAPRRTPFTKKDNPQPGDLITRRVRREVDERVEAQRDRLDPPTDSLGRKRKQMSVDAFTELLVMKGLEWAQDRPDWQDPLALG